MILREKEEEPTPTPLHFSLQGSTTPNLLHPHSRHPHHSRHPRRQQHALFASTCLHNTSPLTNQRPLQSSGQQQQQPDTCSVSISSSREQPLARARFGVRSTQRQHGLHACLASITSNNSAPSPAAATPATPPPAQEPHHWQGSAWLQAWLLKLMPGLKHELDYLAWEQLQGSRLPPGMAAKAAKENERRQKSMRRKPGEPAQRAKKLQVAAGEEELWAIFSEFCGRDGNISSSELRSALLQLGLPCTPEYLNMMMNELDVNHDEKVNWSEFRAFFHKRSLEIEKAFKAFDVNGDGVISKEELKSALFEAGIPADDDTVKKMFGRVDVDDSQSVDLMEFKRFAAFLPVSMGEESADPSLYAAWWRTTTIENDMNSAQRSQNGNQPQANKKLQPSPLNLQNFFLVFDIITRTSLAVSLLVVIGGFAEQND